MQWMNRWTTQIERTWTPKRTNTLSHCSGPSHRQSAPPRFNRLVQHAQYLLCELSTAKFRVNETSDPVDAVPVPR
jgi:hypothetical protein